MLTPNPNECNSTRTSVLGVLSSSFGLRHSVFRRDQKFSPRDKMNGEADLSYTEKN